MAALATMTAALDSPIGLSEIRRLGSGARVDRLESFLGLAGLAGLRAVAMEGGYEDLPSVELPLVMVLRASGEERRFAVLHQVDAEEAWIADPQEGLIRLSRAEVEAVWTGDVVALEREAAAEEEALEELRRRRDPRTLALWCGASVAIFAIAALRALTGLAASEALVSFALAAALSAALWSSLKARSCAVCDHASRLVGALPVAELGVVFYLALWISWMFAPGHPANFTGLAVALGVHGALLRLLLRHRLACTPCLLTAAAALVATGTALAAHPVSMRAVLVLPAFVAVAFAGSVRGLGLSRKVLGWRRRAAAFDLIRTTPKVQTPTGTAHMVVYKRPGCAACAIFDATLRPGLEEAFGEHLSIETRRPDDPAVPTPLVVVSGGATPRVVDVQEHEEPFQALSGAVSAALGGAMATEASSFVWVS